MNVRSRVEGIRARARNELRGASRSQQQEIRQRALDEIREVAESAPVPLRAVPDTSYFDGPAIGSPRVIRRRGR